MFTVRKRATVYARLGLGPAPHATATDELESHDRYGQREHVGADPRASFTISPMISLSENSWAWAWRSMHQCMLTGSSQKPKPNMF